MTELKDKILLNLISKEGTPCEWCGKHLPDAVCLFCSKECEEKYNKQIEERRAKKLCLRCGAKPERPEIEICDECANVICLIADKVDTLLKKAKAGNR